MPQPGTMVVLTDPYSPVMIKGLKINPNDPLLFEFILDTGSSGLRVSDPAFKTESEKLIKYFLAALTIKEEDLWVNLSPYEKGRIVPLDLGQTGLGRDMLAQDYVLKQLTASLIYPGKEIGKLFWDKVYARATPSGTALLPANIFNKVWIVAEKAKVLERHNAAFVVGAHLKVMLEEDYTALRKTTPKATAPAGNSQLVREVILPQIEQEINHGKHFAPLRQMFYSMVLATWYKMAVKEALLNRVYSNKAKISGVMHDDPQIKEKIYGQYLEAYKRGVFNFIKEDVDAASGKRVPRKYFSGGTAFRDLPRIIDRAQSGTAEELAGIAQGDMAMGIVRLEKVKVKRPVTAGAGIFDEELRRIQTMLSSLYLGDRVQEEASVELRRFIARHVSNRRSASPELRLLVREVFEMAIDLHTKYVSQKQPEKYSAIFSFVRSLNGTIAGVPGRDSVELWTDRPNYKMEKFSWDAVAGRIVAQTIEDARKSYDRAAVAPVLTTDMDYEAALRNVRRALLNPAFSEKHAEQLIVELRTYIASHSKAPLRQELVEFLKRVFEFSFSLHNQFVAQKEAAKRQNIFMLIHALDYYIWGVYSEADEIFVEKPDLLNPGQWSKVPLSEEFLESIARESVDYIRGTNDPFMSRKHLQIPMKLGGTQDIFGEENLLAIEKRLADSLDPIGRDELKDVVNYLQAYRDTRQGPDALYERLVYLYQLRAFDLFLREKDKAMIGGEGLSPGGIDFNPKKMGLDTAQDNPRALMQFDQALLEEFQRGDFSGITPTILRILPITSPVSTLGLEVKQSSL